MAIALCSVPTGGHTVIFYFLFCTFSFAGGRHYAQLTRRVRIIRGPATGRVWVTLLLSTQAT